MLIICETTALADEDSISSIDISALLQADGAAVITETWDVRGISNGTEYYKSLNNMEGMSVHSFSVRDESGTLYTPRDSWDTGMSLKEKAYTSGILETSDGYELCWGMGSYGDHVYTIQYTLTGLVKDYSDYAGFYHRFVSELSSPPESVSIQIMMPDVIFTADNARIWAYGFEGEVDISEDGSLTVYSSYELLDDDYVNVLCRFDRSMFTLPSVEDVTFEELQGTADTEDSDIALIIIGIVGAIVIVAAIIVIIFLNSRFKLADGTKVKLPGNKQLETSGNDPFSGSLPAAYCAMKMLRRSIPCQNLMGAYLIRWEAAGYIRIEERSVDTGSKRKKEVKEGVIVFTEGNRPRPEVERALYDILLGGADRDGVLWESDIKEWAEELSQDLALWADDVELEGESELLKSGAVANDAKGNIRFTASGFDRAVRLFGFKKYLTELSTGSKDRTAPVELWGNYLVFAAMFGIGEQVLKCLHALNPAYFDTFSGMYGYNAFTMIHLMTVTDSISNAALTNIDGTGGASMPGGGGGFSGGGGGSR